ncbi:MAG: SRPBCC family protein [Actinobacteria bacterium]|nr:SRPBCC family protein [Actinomycetota bacterium]
MTNQLRAVGLEFLKEAPNSFDFEAEVHAPPAVVFAAIAADPSTWTRWFPGLERGSYEGDGPRGVGTRREVSMTGITYRETMLAWDEPTRWAYRIDESSADMFHALVEDWVVEPKGDHSVVRWTFAIDPTADVIPLLGTLPEIVGQVFADAMAGLDGYLAREVGDGAG